MKFVIHGGKPLEGEITLAGGKNAASKLMVLSLLTKEPCTLDNFPDIGETEITAELCRNIGSSVRRRGKSVTIHTPEIETSRVHHLSRRNRVPILALGPLLVRTGSAEVPILGGDRIGPRPVDLHIKALEALGATVEATEDRYIARAKSGLHGAAIDFPFPSVGATEQAIFAAVCAKGETVIRNAALEPEVMSVVKMLQKMGAIIELGAQRDIHIEGVAHLRGTRHRVLPDRNEAVSFACLAIATGGKILVKDAVQDHLITFLNAVRRMGADYEVVREGIVFSRPRALQPLRLETAPHPGFMTDWQQPIAILLTQARGVSMIHETIYEDRFGYMNDLRDMGARVNVFTDCPGTSVCRFDDRGVPHRASIEGPTELTGGKTLRVRDLRSGIVDMIAALVAKGETTIEGVEEIDRGYERIDERIRSLGAAIERVKT